MSHTHKKGLPYFALGLVCIIWGTTYLANKIGVNDIPPFLFTAVRQLFAGGILLFIMVAFKNSPVPRGKDLVQQAILGFLLIGIGNGIGTFGLQYIESGVSSLLASLTPIVLALLVHFIVPNERLSRRGWIGIAVGTIGILLICYDKLSTPVHPLAWVGFLLTGASVLAWSTGSVLTKKTRNQTTPPLTNAAIQMLSGGFMLLICWAMFERETVELSWKFVGIWAYLIIFGSIVAYGSFIYALRHLPATIVSVHTYVNPVIAVWIGWLVLSEGVNIRVILGAILCLTGVYIVNSSQFKKIRPLKRFRKRSRDD